MTLNCRTWAIPILLAILHSTIPLIDAHHDVTHRTDSDDGQIEHELFEETKAESTEYDEIRPKFIPNLPLMASRRLTHKPQVLFVYNSERYSPWTDWTECIPNLCLEHRYRKCLDSSWNTTFGNPHLTMKCPSKYVAEKRRCQDPSGCEMNAGLQLVSDLKETCGKRPKLSNRGRSRWSSRGHFMKIIGGQKSTPHSWPWAVRLSLGKRREVMTHICGGTLIAPNWILTAAHCLMVENPHIPVGRMINMHDYMTYLLIAHIGDHYKRVRDAKQQDHIIDRAIIHPRYNRKLRTDGYDIALLHLKKSVETSDEISYACQPEASQTVTSGRTCMAVGWGGTRAPDEPTFDNIESIIASLMQLRPGFSQHRRLRSGQRRIADELHEVQVPIVSNSECSRYYGYLTDHHICAGSNGKDTCDGDSGGGLYCQDTESKQWYLTGITSFGLSRGCGTHPGVYTSTSSHFDWIASTISNPPALER